MSTAIPNGLSYEYQNLVRDLSNAFETLVAGYPTLISLVQNGPAAINTKHEFLEDSLANAATTITSFVTDGDGVGINVGSTAGFRVGSILRLATAADVTRTEQVQVGAVVSATQITVVRDYGSTVGQTFLVGDKVILASSPIGENTDAVPDAGQEPIPNYNYVQIFDRTAEISKTAAAVKIYGLEKALDYQVKLKLQQLMFEMNSAMIYGRRVVRSSGVPGTVGGLLQFMESGNIDTTGGAVSAAIINNMMQAIFTDGSHSNNLALVCADNQARKISAFNSAGLNPQIQTGQRDKQTFGYAISKFVGDLPVMDGFTAPIVVDPNFPRDQVAIIDLDRVEVNALEGRNFTDEDAAAKAKDGFARRVLGEFTFTIKNGTKSHALATGLTV